MAIRDSRWKRHRLTGRPQVELHDFKQSPDEVQNVAAQHAHVASRLSEQLLKWRKSLPELL